MSAKKNKATMAIPDYVERHLIPEKRAAGVDLTPRTCGYYRSLALQLTECVGSKVTMRSIADTMIFQYENWLVERGYNPTVAHRRAEDVRSIVRHALPER